MALWDVMTGRAEYGLTEGACELWDHGWMNQSHTPETPALLTALTAKRQAIHGFVITGRTSVSYRTVPLDLADALGLFALDLLGLPIFRHGDQGFVTGKHLFF